MDKAADAMSKCGWLRFWLACVLFSVLLLSPFRLSVIVIASVWHVRCENMGDWTRRGRAVCRNRKPARLTLSWFFLQHSVSLFLIMFSLFSRPAFPVSGLGTKLIHVETTIKKQHANDKVSSIHFVCWRFFSCTVILCFCSFFLCFSISASFVTQALA